MKSTEPHPDERCERCGKPMISKRVQVYRRRGSRHVLFKNVPAFVCLSCGERLFDDSAVEAMEHGLRCPGSRARKAELTIITV
jgi:YgiT-type zinc finger domain-containing protein